MITSKEAKEALDTLLGYASFNENYYFHKGKDPYGIIKHALERLEELEAENKRIKKRNIDIIANEQNLRYQIRELEQELEDKENEIEELEQEVNSYYEN